MSPSTPTAPRTTRRGGPHSPLIYSDNPRCLKTPRCLRYHFVYDTTLSTTPRCLRYHFVLDTTLSTTPRCLRYHFVQDTTLSTIPLCPRHHIVYDTTLSTTPRCFKAALPRLVFLYPSPPVEKKKTNASTSVKVPFKSSEYFVYRVLYEQTVTNERVVCE